jgi:hypothetical protein
LFSFLSSIKNNKRKRRRIILFSNNFIEERDRNIKIIYLLFSFLSSIKNNKGKEEELYYLFIGFNNII